MGGTQVQANLIPVGRNLWKIETVLFFFFYNVALKADEVSESIFGLPTSLCFCFQQFVRARQPHTHLASGYFPIPTEQAMSPV